MLIFTLKIQQKIKPFITQQKVSFVFSLHNFRSAYPEDEEDIVEDVQVLDNVLTNWIAYIGRKYPRLLDLRLNLDTHWDVELVVHEEIVTESLENALKNMKHLKCY